MTVTAHAKKAAFARFALVAMLAVAILAPVAVTTTMPVAAQGTPPASGTPTPPPPAPPPRTNLVNPLGRGVTIATLLGRFTRMIMGLSGSFALLMFVYGAFLWVTSGGNTDKVTKGKKIFTWATIGLVVIFGAYVLVSTVFKALSG